MKKLNVSMWRLVSVGSLLVVGAGVSVAGCSETEADLSGGGAGGEGGESAGTGGAGTGGSQVSCDAPSLGQGGNGGAGGAAGEEIAIAGTYDDEFGGTIIFSADGVKYYDDEFHFSSVDNGSGLAIARNDEGNAYNPCLWSRFVWTTSDEELYYCQSPFAATDEQAAIDADLPDVSDLETGCDGFAWSKITAQ